jgi:YHS domain-containing protein
MKTALFTFMLGISSVFAQQIDYNIKKGYVVDGYDVVAYFNNEALEGDKNFTAEYDGAKFKFVSQKNLDIFKSNPEKYIPQYGGYCAYAVADKGEKVEINPKTFEIRDGKLYLFYNAWGTNTLKLWLKEDVKGLQKKADKNWEGIKHNK